MLHNQENYKEIGGHTVKSMPLMTNHSESEMQEIHKAMADKGNVIPSSDQMHDMPEHKKKYG